MKVSVIVANYNYEAYLPQAIESVLQQNYSKLEIILVDDGSTDGSRSIIKQLVDQYSHVIKVIFQENQGHGNAIYAAFKISTGEIISFLDSDDMWTPTKLTRVLHTFASNSEIIGVIHQLDTVDSQGKILTPASPIPKIHQGDLARLLLDTGAAWVYPPTSGISLRRSVLAQILPIEPIEWRKWPDGSLLYCAGMLGKVVSLPETLGSYRNHGSNTHWRSPDQNIHRQTEALDGVYLTTLWINQFLEKIGSFDRVNILDNLNYRRDKYYLEAQFRWSELQIISGLILSWPFYNWKEQITFLARFWIKNFKFVLNTKKSMVINK
jgi:glycosyltransferase involved in cell wall biosynthesis